MRELGFQPIIFFAVRIFMILPPLLQILHSFYQFFPFSNNCQPMTNIRVFQVHIDSRQRIVYYLPPLSASSVRTERFLLRQILSSSLLFLLYKSNLFFVKIFRYNTIPKVIYPFIHLVSKNVISATNRRLIVGYSNNEILILFVIVL